MASNPPAIIVGNALLKGTVAASQEWRRHGEARRRELLENDSSSQNFQVHNRCSVLRYFTIADRVLAQFRDLYEQRRNLEEIFVMGHRLIAFYTKALPSHKDYRSIDPSISTRREQSFVDLEWIRKRLTVIALRIDEEQLNLHMQRQEQEESASVGAKATDDQQETQWESFSGWSVDFTNTTEALKSEQSQAQAPRTVRSLIHLNDTEDAVDDPADILDLDSEEETSVDSDDDDDGSLSETESDERAVRFEMSQEEEGYDSSFLRVIASEEVEYEEDSEAVDSWAQDDESLESLAEHAPIASRSTTSIAYSEAETLRNLLNRVAQGASYHESEASKTVSLPPPLSSDHDCPADELENLDPATTSFSSVSTAAKDTTNTICSYPSFDEPPDEDEDTMASPQDVMQFEAHSSMMQKAPSSRHVKKGSASFSDEELVPIYLPGLRI